jgi:hypothetical protein
MWMHDSPVISYNWPFIVGRLAVADDIGHRELIGTGEVVFFEDPGIGTMSCQLSREGWAELGMEVCRSEGASSKQ